jgi:hypothetical protein
LDFEKFKSLKDKLILCIYVVLFCGNVYYFAAYRAQSNVSGVRVFLKFSTNYPVEFKLILDNSITKETFTARKKEEKGNAVE